MKLVEKALARKSRLEQKLEIVEDNLQKILSSDRYEIRRVGQAFLNTRGKRYRPTILLLSSELADYEGADDERLAAAVEIVHLATLVHDDIIDEACLRRGLKSVNTEWGNEIAVLFGDFLYTRAVEEALKIRRFDILELLAKTVNGMIEGELAQLYRRGSDKIGEEELFEIIRRKTAQLFLCCARIGGMVANLPEGKLNVLADFGLNFGIAFQLMDDLLDYTAEEERLGKPLFADLAEGKVTIPFLYFTADGDGAFRRLLQDSLGDAEKVRRHRADIRKMVAQSDAVVRIRERIASYIEKAAQNLDEFPASSPKDALKAFVETTISREK